jgi:hypothetical protein
MGSALLNRYLAFVASLAGDCRAKYAQWQTLPNKGYSAFAVNSSWQRCGFFTN